MKKKNNLTRREFLEIGGLGAMSLMMAQNAISQPEIFDSQKYFNISSLTEPIA